MKCDVVDCPNDQVWLHPASNLRLCRDHLPKDDSAAFRIVPEEEQTHECPGANGDSEPTLDPTRYGDWAAIVERDAVPEPQLGDPAANTSTAAWLLESVEAGERTAAENRKLAEHYATQAVLAAAIRWQEEWLKPEHEAVDVLDALSDAVDVYRRAVAR
jgi:hypothetical protein